MIESFSINPDREMQLQIRHLGMNQMVRRRLADTVMTKLQPTNENWTGPLFQLFNGMSVVQGECFPDNRIGLFDGDMVLLGWVQLRGDNEARKKEGIEWLSLQSRIAIEKFEDNKIKEKFMGERFEMGEALTRLRAGKKVQREGWNGKGMWIALQVPDEHSKMSLPYLYMKTADDKLVPWLASQTDILAEDWREV